MTEFKRLAAFIDELAAFTSSLGDRIVALPPNSETAARFEKAYALRDEHSRLVRQATDDVGPRMARMVDKAKITDPELRTYNDVMCQRITDLSAVFAVQQDALLDATAPIDELFLDATRRHAATVAWEAQVMQGFDAVAQREQATRALIVGDQAAAWTEILLDSRQARVEICRLEREAIDQRRLAELRRREAELAAACAVELMPPNEKHQALRHWGTELAGLGMVGRITIKHLAGIAEAVVRQQPGEVGGVRRIRTNNHEAIAHLGHPFVVVVPGSPPAASDVVEMALQLTVRERRRFALVEKILFLFGYRPAYDDDCHGMVTNYATLAQSVPMADPREAPFKLSLVPQRTWDLYGERYLELQEVDPNSDPDAWCRWYDSVQLYQSILDEVVKATHL